MEWIKGDQEPATKEDLRLLQATVIAASIGSCIVNKAVLDNAELSDEDADKFIDIALRIIGKSQKRVLLMHDCQPPR